MERLKILLQILLLAVVLTAAVLYASPYAPVVLPQGNILRIHWTSWKNFVKV